MRASAGTFNAPLKWNHSPIICSQCGTSNPEEQQGKGYCRQCDYAARQWFHRRRVFSLSLGDWLDPEVPVEWLADMLDMVRRCDQLIWLLLTKRPELWHIRMDGAFYSAWEKEEKQTGSVIRNDPLSDWLAEWIKGNAVPKNIWIGVSVEDQQRANERRSAFEAIPVAVKFVSYEPALGKVDWAGWQFVNQVIMGVESGASRRPCDVRWFENTAEWCVAHNIAAFVKQDCALRPGCQGRIPDVLWQLKQFPSNRPPSAEVSDGRSLIQTATGGESGHSPH